jgi:hypothetical protein
MKQPPLQVYGVLSFIRLLLAWHSPCTLTLIPQTTLRLCRRTAPGGPLDIETARGHTV